MCVSETLTIYCCHLTGVPQPLPAAPGSQPASIAPLSQQPADKYSAIADLESVFSSTSISGGFGFQGTGLTWPREGVMGTGAGMWVPQAMPYNSDGRGQPVNMGQTVPQMFGVNSAANSTAGPPSYATIAGKI